MQDFILIFRNEKPDGDQMPSEEQMQAQMKPWQEWIAGIAAQGKFTGTNRLLPLGKTIKANKVITDGPYVEAKEMIGGYLIVKANSLGEAVDLAKGCPIYAFGGNVEVRGVMPIDANNASGNFLEAPAKATV